MSNSCVSNNNESYFHDDLTGYLVGNNGTVLRSENFAFNPATGVYTAGSWTSKAANDGLNNHTTNANLNITSIAFSDRYSGFIGGDYNNSVQTNATADYARRLNDESNYFSTRFWYDKLGRIVVSQNSRQYVEPNGKRYSYTTYDALGRVEEAGEKVENVSGSGFASVFGTNVNNFYNPKVIDDANLNAWINNASGQRTEVTHTYYDAPNATIATALPNNFSQENLRKRVTCVVYEEVWDNNDATYSHATHYTYDIHGNVNTLLQDNPNTGVAGQEFKRLDYEYDLISGNVNEVAYQNGELDMMIHRYEYDADNRITSVETSTDGVFYDNDAKYFYYAHGPLARTELGENHVQGLDYVYTLQGWIKGVNSNTLDSTRDVGQDGNRIVGNPNAYFAKDVFGYTLNYFNGDYTAINGTVSQTANNFESDKTNSDLLANREDFFNGNISAMVTTITNPTTGEVLPQGMAYDYDQLNRLLSAKAFVNLDMQNNVWQSGSTYANRYYNAFTYDANGNILTQQRYAENGTQIEDMTYQYNRNTNGKMLQNRLYHVNDSVTANAFTDDIDDQGAFSLSNLNTSNNYGYDGEGRLVRDDAEEIAQITWTVTGKVKEVIRTSGSTKKNLKFRYDAMGQRIAKEVYDSQGNWEKTTYYVRDPQGNVMGIYEKKNDVQTQQLSYKITERNIYGSSMVGLVKSEIELINASAPNGTNFVHAVGEKQYYEQNHLSNVISVVSDLKIAQDWNGDMVVDYYRAEIISSTDFYAFGHEMQERKFSSSQVRAGFNGKEKDDEWNVDGGSYDFGARMYDARLGRWLSVDQLSKQFPSHSAYCFSINSPLIFTDPDGKVVKPMSSEALEAITLGLTPEESKYVQLDKHGNINKRLLKKGARKLKESENYSELLHMVKQKTVVEIYSSPNVTHKNQKGETVVDEEIFQGSVQNEIFDYWSVIYGGSEDKSGTIKVPGVNEPMDYQQWSEYAVNTLGLNGEDSWGGTTGITLYPHTEEAKNSDYPYYSTNGNIQIYINSKAPKRTRVLTTAHETYGHAYFKIIGKPSSHGTYKGPCDDKPDCDYNKELEEQIKARVEEAAGNYEKNKEK